jgi:hypothetical protein
MRFKILLTILFPILLTLSFLSKGFAFEKKELPEKRAKQVAFKKSLKENGNIFSFLLGLKFEKEEETTYLTPDTLKYSTESSVDKYPLINTINLITLPIRTKLPIFILLHQILI